MMTLAQIKKSGIPKRKLFQIERAVVREMTDLWFKQGCYFGENFSKNVEISSKGEMINVTVMKKKSLKYGHPESTVNELMKGFILTMATDPSTHELLENFEDIIGNILDVFVYRLKEIGGSRFLFHRLQSLELGFGVSFGLGEPYYPIRKARHFLEEVVTSASSLSPEEAVDGLYHDFLETERLGLKDQGVTFHIIMEKESEASFISLPLGIQQTNYVSLLNAHALRCNIIGNLTAKGSQLTGILKIDAPAYPLKFVHHKGFYLELDEKALMEKLSTPQKIEKKDFSPNELSFIKLLFNEYVNLASFLLKSKKIDPSLKLLIIFPRINFFQIMHQENAQIPAHEPQTLGELASYHHMIFPLQSLPPRQKEKESHRIPEKTLQERRIATIKALSHNIAENVHKPLVSINRDLNLFLQEEYSNRNFIIRIHTRLTKISSYLKKLQTIKRVVFTEDKTALDLEASILDESKEARLDALDEIARNIQLAEIEQIKKLSEIIVSKMLDYLSFVTSKLQILQKVVSPSIKLEITKEVQSYTNIILSQSEAFYRLVKKR